MASIFPEEIIQEILLRLPVKSLVRFRCVSKTWAALIESPSFVKSHLNQSTITKSMADIIFVNFRNCVKLNQLRYESSDNIVIEEFKHPFSRRSYSSSPEIMGSCCGLLYMIKSCNSNAILFNPSTRNHFKIPNIEEVEGLISRIKSEHHPFDVAAIGSFSKWWYCGFGYDEVNDDFKLIGIKVEKSYRNREWEYFGWIYSIKLGTWRRIDDMPNCHITSADQCGTLLYNAIHWVIYDHPFEMTTPRFIIAFDMGTEEFRLMPLPNYIKNDSRDYDNFNLEVLDECLCFSCCSSSEDDVICFLEFWIMREYAANASNWVKLVKIGFESECGIWTVKPLAFSENGKLLLVFVKDYDYNHTLAWYDLETGLLKRKIDKLPRDLGVPHLYIPSLVNPNPHAKLL